MSGRIIGQQVTEFVYSETRAVYTQLGFLEAMGDTVALQFMQAVPVDPVIALIDRKFQAASDIDPMHSATQQAFAYLVASELVPDFTQSLADTLAAGPQ